MTDAITKGLTKLDGHLYINKRNGDIFTIHGNWLRTHIGSIKNTKSFDKFNDTFGTENGDKARKEIAAAIMAELSE